MAAPMICLLMALFADSAQQGQATTELVLHISSGINYVIIQGLYGEGRILAIPGSRLGKGLPRFAVQPIPENRVSLTH